MKEPSRKSHTDVTFACYNRKEKAKAGAPVCSGGAATGCAVAREKPFERFPLGRICKMRGRRGGEIRADYTKFSVFQEEA